MARRDKSFFVVDHVSNFVELVTNKVRADIERHGQPFFRLIKPVLAPTADRPDHIVSNRTVPPGSFLEEQLQGWILEDLAPLNFDPGNFLKGLSRGRTLYSCLVAQRDAGSPTKAFDYRRSFPRVLHRTVKVYADWGELVVKDDRGEVQTVS